MKKKIIIGAVILLILVVTVIVIIIVNKDDSSKRLELTYKTNGGVPFKWEYEIEDRSIVKFVKSYQIYNDNKGSKAGGPIYTNYVFKGLKEGKTKITFKYVSITDGRVAETEEHIAKVDKDGNIALVVNSKK